MNHYHPATKRFWFLSVVLRRTIMRGTTLTVSALAEAMPNQKVCRSGNYSRADFTLTAQYE